MGQERFAFLSYTHGMQPFFTAIIPTFNRLATIERAIDSVLNQVACGGVELFVVDDGSSDGTSELVTSKYGSRVRLFRTENRGVSAARNLAAQNASGQWLAFLDSDDEWFQDKLKRQRDFIEQNPDISIVHGEEIWIRRGVRVNAMKKHQKRGGNLFLDCLPLCCISPSTVVLKKDLFFQVGGFREDFVVCEDYDLWLKITREHSVGFIDTPLITKFGGHEDQLSRRFVAMDYWRLKSLSSILTMPLSAEHREAALAEFVRKKKILLKGYRRHQNLSFYDEVFFSLSLGAR